MSWDNPRPYGPEESGRRNRTPIPHMFLRICVVPTVIMFPFVFMLSGCVAIYLTPIMAFIGTLFTTIPVWFVCNTLYTSVHGDEEDCQRFYAQGGDVFWDIFLMWPFNPDSQRVRQGGVDPCLPVPSHLWDQVDWPHQTICPTCWNKSYQVYDKFHSGCHICDWYVSQGVIKPASPPQNRNPKQTNTAPMKRRKR